MKLSHRKFIITCMLVLSIFFGALSGLSGCSQAAWQTVSVPADTMLPYHEEYEKRDDSSPYFISWDGYPNSLVEMRANKEYEFLAEVQIGRYQRCYANGELGGISIFTATITKVLDVLDKKNTPKVGTVILLGQGSTPKCTGPHDPLYVEGDKYVLPLALCSETFYERADNYELAGHPEVEEVHAIRKDYPVLYMAYGFGVGTLRIAEVDGKEYVLVMGFGEKELGSDDRDEHFLEGLELKLADDELTEKVLLKLYGSADSVKYRSAYSYDAFISAVEALK